MDPNSYAAFTEALCARLAGDDRVLGFVALGSMASRDYLPDLWSDHDFFVVVVPGSAEHFRTDLSWLPGHADIVLALRETIHGLKVLYGDAHLIEFAVFTPDELSEARAGRSRVLVDRGGVLQAIESISGDATPQVGGPDLRYELGMFATNVLVGDGRHRRGEWLSAHQLVAGYALDHLLRVLTVQPSPESALLDGLDVRRRFERVHPALGAELGRLLSEPVPAMAAGMIRLAKREVGHLAPPDIIEALRIVEDALRLDRHVGEATGSILASP